MKDKSILFLIISGVLLIILVINSFRYNHLSKEFNEFKKEYTEQVDSLTWVNHELEKQINEYKENVIHLETAIDSLEHIKNKIIIQKDDVIVSKSVSDGVELLKKNLERWEN